MKKGAFGGQNMGRIGNKKIALFITLVCFVAFANGLSDAILSNYFKEVYLVDAMQRAFIEFPRELPGMLCVVVIGLLSFLGDIRLALIAQILASIGLLVLGVWTPSFSVMLIFLFIYSMGMHLFMPLSDSIGMSLAEPEHVGKRVGQYGSAKTAFTFVSGIVVFFGFRTGVLSFDTEIKWVFILSAAAFIGAAIVAYRLLKEVGGTIKTTTRKKVKFIFRKEYKLYYILTILNGVQKQIAYVFGSWVIIDMLLKGADTMSLLILMSGFLGMFFFRYVGKWIDTKGIRFMMFFDALSFIFVYSIYGILVWGVSSNWFPDMKWATILIYILFVLDRLSMQVGIIKSVYLRSIALSPEDVTSALSTGISLDHLVSIIAAQISGFIWVSFGPQWVFFFAAFLSLGNLFVASLVPKDKKA